MDSFYGLLVKESILKSSNDSDTHEKSLAIKSTDENVQKTVLFDDKLAFEISQSIGKSSNYFKSYLTRTVFELMTAAGLLVWLLVRGFYSLNQDNEYLICEIGKVHYHCAGEPLKFYLYILIATLIILSLFLAISFYVLIWMFSSKFGSLSGIMSNHETFFKSLDPSETETMKISGSIYDLYYKNKDLKLLLDLLGATSGIAPCLKLLCLFDKNMQKKTQVNNLDLSVTDNLEVKIQFEDPEAMEEVFRKIPETFTYSIEIEPALPSVSDSEIIL